MLVDLVRDLLYRIAPTWEAAFARHGLDLHAADTASELARALNIDWTDPGVADLCRSTYRSIESGDPAPAWSQRLRCAASPSPVGDTAHRYSAPN